MKTNLSKIRAKAGAKGALSRWGVKRPTIARISVERDLRAQIENIDIRERVRVTSKALRIGLEFLGFV